MGNPDPAALHNQERKKQRPVTYPRLHEALFVWIMAIEKEVTITGTIPGRGIWVWRLDGGWVIFENIYTINVSLH